MSILRVITLIVAVVVSGCQHHRADERQAVSPRQADDLLSSLDRAKILDYCGPAQESHVNPGIDPNSFLTYPFGHFDFEDGGSPLMGVSMRLPGEKHAVVWENAHRESTSKNKMMVVTHRNLVKLAEYEASLDNISVYELEGKRALKILENTPCMAGLLTRY
jgi:hypothetical protein